MSENKPVLVSFKLCPFVQRAAIVLREKRVEFETVYIDLADKPDWFLKLSPLGKVPLLRVGETVLFESAVINEYLDEVYGPQLHPADPLQRARNRAWIEFGSALIMDQYLLSITPDHEQFAALRERLTGSLDRLERQLGNGPYFNGGAFALVDAAMAPVFHRFAILDRYVDLGMYSGRPRVTEYSQALLGRAAVQQSVAPDFAELYVRYLRDRGGVIAAQLPAVAGEAVA